MTPDEVDDGEHADDGEAKGDHSLYLVIELMFWPTVAEEHEAAADPSGQAVGDDNCDEVETQRTTRDDHAANPRESRPMATTQTPTAQITFPPLNSLPGDVFADEGNAGDIQAIFVR